MDYNKNFDSLAGVPDKLLQCLMAGGKVYVTTCRMNGIDAAKAMNMDLSEFDIGERTYGGHIIADSFEEAVQISIQREFGEKVDGVLCDMMDLDDPLINAYDTSGQTN